MAENSIDTVDLGLAACFPPPVEEGIEFRDWKRDADFCQASGGWKLPICEFPAWWESDEEDRVEDVSHDPTEEDGDDAPSEAPG